MSLRRVGKLLFFMRTIQRYARPRSANLYCSLNGGMRQGLTEGSIGAPDQSWFYERVMGSTCGVHEVTYGQFSNLN
jgi:hypothetical protein